MLNHQSIDSYCCQGREVMKNAFECALCSFLCDNENVFRSHLNAEHKSNFLPCIYCETLYNASHFLLRHLKATHSLEAKVYHCGSVECSFKTIIVKRFLSHLDLCTVGKTIKCYHCKSTFSSPNLLILHMQGQLKILLNKAYPIDKIIRIVPSPASQSISVLQTHSNIKEPKSSTTGNPDKTGKANDALPVHTFANQSVPHIPVPIVSSSPKRFSYILPKSVVVKPMLKAIKTYSCVTTPQVAAQEVSVTRKVSNDENSPHILKDAVVASNPPNTRNSNTFISSSNLSKNSVLDVSSSGKLTNVSVCQLPLVEISTTNPSQASKVINKTAIITTNVSPSTAMLENELPKKDSLGDSSKGNRLVTLTSVNVDAAKNVSVKNIIPNNKTHSAIFSKSSNMVYQTDLPVSVELNSLKVSSWQKSTFDKNVCNVAYPKKHCIKIPSKIMFIPVPPPPPVYTLMQPEFCRSDSYTGVSVFGGAQTTENNSFLAKQSSVKVIQSLNMGSINQTGSQSSISFPPSSTSCDLKTVPKNNCNSELNTLLELSSIATPHPSSNNVLNLCSVKLETPLHQNSLKDSASSAAAVENCISKDTSSSTVSSLFSTPETLPCGSCNVTSEPYDVSSVEGHCKDTDHTFKSITVPPCAASITGTDTAVSGTVAKFVSESEVDDQAELPGLKKHVRNENILPLKFSELTKKLCTNSYFGKHHDKCDHYEGSGGIQASNCNVHSQKRDNSTSAAKQNSSETAVSEICPSSCGSQIPVVSPMTAVIKEELITPFSCTNRMSSMSTSPTSVTYIKQEVISSYDRQFEAIVPSFTVKSKVASDDRICDRFSDYYGDIAAVVSSHSLLTQRDSNAGVSAASGSLISPARQSDTSVCTSAPVFSSMFTAVKEKLPSSPFSCTDSLPLCPTSTLVTSIKQESISACDLECKTPPLSPVVEKTLVSTDGMFRNLFTFKSERTSSALGEASQSAGEKSSDIVVIKPVIEFSEKDYSSHHTTFSSLSSSNISNIHKEKYGTAVNHSADGSEFICTPSVPVSSQCIKSMTAFSASSFPGFSQILSNAYSSCVAYTGTVGFDSISSAYVPRLTNPAVLLNKSVVCDVTFTTLSIKPEMSSNPSLSRAVLPSINARHNDKNSVRELPLCAPISYHSETMRNEACGISSSQHSAKIFSNVVPVKLIIATSVGCTASKSSNGVQCGEYVSTAVSSDINKNFSSASCISQISTTSSISDSQHTFFRHSTCSPVTSFCESNSQGQSFSTDRNDHQSSHTDIRILENNIPHPDDSCSVTGSELSIQSVLPETAKKSVTKSTRESAVSYDAYDERKSVPCVSSSLNSPDDRHPFLNSTNMTVRQILDKFRGKYKNGNINTSKKTSLRTTSQTCKNVKDIRKQHIQSSNLLLYPSCKTLTPRANKTILKPTMLKEVSHPPGDTGLTVVQDTSVVSCKRKGSQLLEMNTTAENPTLKAQNVEQQQLISLSEHKEKHLYMEFNGECSNEQSISGNTLTFDEYCFSQLENEALSGNHNVEDMCSASDILQVARELLSYSETPGEPAGELTDVLQSLKQRKSEKALKEMLQPLKLRDFFKCMAQHCSYTSNICVKFSRHLKEHDAFCCTCAYCLVDFPARDNLICHLMQEHKRSLFQCSLCFYRAYSQTQVCIHFRKFHSCEKGHIITCSPVDTHPVSTFKENYMVYYASIAKPYRCCFHDCLFSCVAMLDVIHHILYSHPVCSLYVCVECKKQHSDIFEWLIHCQVHGIHLFDCIHCAFGAETRTDMLYHISMYHANESLVVFVRSSRHLMLHLECILKYNKIANLKNLCDTSDASLCMTKDQFETEEVQVILENTISTDGILKCLYCLCSTEYVPEMQKHLYSKHSQNDVLHYYFCQSQFETVSEAHLIFENLLSSYSSKRESTACIDMILSDRSSLTVNQPTVPLQIIFVETANGIVNLHLPLSVCKRNTFRGKYLRIFQSLYNQIQSKIHRKRFKCLYCKKTERYLYKLRQHWRCCHVQTGKKFKYELINRKRCETATRIHETCSFACGNIESKQQDHETNVTLDVHSCSTCHFCICSNKTSENVISNRNSLCAWNHLHRPQCDSTLKIMDSFLHERPDRSAYGVHPLCCNSHNVLRSTKVPSEEHSFHKCNCKVCAHTICRMFKQCCAKMTGNHIGPFDVENKMKQLRNQYTRMVNSYRFVASCYCLMKCSKKGKCFKKQKSGENDKLCTHVNNVKLKVFLRKLPYSVKLPVLYLKEIINLDPVVVLSDIKYQCKMK